MCRRNRGVRVASYGCTGAQRHLEPSFLAGKVPPDPFLNGRIHAGPPYITAGECFHSDDAGVSDMQSFQDAEMELQ